MPSKWASDPVLIAGMFLFVFLLFTAGLVPALLVCYVPPRSA